MSLLYVHVHLGFLLFTMNQPFSQKSTTGHPSRYISSKLKKKLWIFIFSKSRCPEGCLHTFLAKSLHWIIELELKYFRKVTTDGFSDNNWRGWWKSLQVMILGAKVPRFVYMAIYHNSVETRHCCRCLFHEKGNRNFRTILLIPASTWLFS